jgi:hypothetical protein
VEAVELAHDLWRWTGRRDSIGAEVGSVYYKSGSDVLLFDPLLPAEDPDGFWQALDRDVGERDTVHVLLTSEKHRRSAQEMLDRYPGSRYWGPQADVELPAQVRAHPSGRSGEVLFYLVAHRALVVGDVIAGDGEGGLRLGVEADRESVLTALDNLDVEIELVIPSHGDPVRDGAALGLV